MKWVLYWAMHRRVKGEWPGLMDKYEAAQPGANERGEVTNMITMAQQLYQDGIRDGVREGEIKGKIEGTMQMLLRQGNKRFGEASKETRECLKAIQDPAVLEDLSLRLLDVNSWEELLAGLHAKS